MNYDLDLLKEIVIRAAREELLPHFADVQRNLKADGSFVTAVDLAMQARITDELKQHYPNTAMLGEEMSADEQQALLENSESLWCLDPLDGTSNFAVGIPYYSVSLGLIEKGVPTLGIIYDPTRDECFVAARGQGAFINGRPLQVGTVDLPMSKCTALVDYKRLSPELAFNLVSLRPFSSQRSFGSIALDWCWLAASRVHLYLHGEQRLWDYVAGHLIFSEAGGHSSTLAGEPVYARTLTPRSSVAALDKPSFDQWYNWLIDNAGKRNNK
ncbi:MAG: inositol monophosphatase family protein [Gammaproteobacteria bacterium]|nr:inositol monophosphatase family protein [Gammaproteobacteria bacterium]